MLRMFRTLFVSLVFALVVLVLGNLISWKGQTVSDQVKTTMAQVEKNGLEQSLSDLKDFFSPVELWIRSLQTDSARGHRAKRLRQIEANPEEDLNSSEKEELKSLLRN